MIVEINKKAYQAKEGDNLEDVIKQNFKQKNIVAAKVNDKLTDLSDCIEDNSKIETLIDQLSEGDNAYPVVCSTSGKLLGEIDRSIVMKSMKSKV